MFCFLNKVKFPTLSLQSVVVFLLKIACKSEKFRARGVEDVRYF